MNTDTWTWRNRSLHLRGTYVVQPLWGTASQLRSWLNMATTRGPRGPSDAPTNVLVFAHDGTISSINYPGVHTRVHPHGGVSLGMKWGRG